MAEFRMEEVEPVRVAYVEMTGPYEDFGRGLMELVVWLRNNGVRVAGQPIGLFYDNPTGVPPEELRSEACIPIAGDVRPSWKFKVKELPGGTVAVTRHTGPPERYTETYGPFLEGILNSGYTILGPAWEIYEEPRADLKPGMGIAIKQLVGKK